ncbi:MAG: putative Ig domain-containing protein [Acidobacteriota bacterium]
MKVRPSPAFAGGVALSIALAGRGAAAAPCAIAIDPPAIPTARLGVAFREPLAASGGVPPYTFAVSGGALPAGILLSTSGIVGGTPTASGASSVLVTATDALGCSVDRVYVVNVAPSADVLAGAGGGAPNAPRIALFSSEGPVALLDMLAYGSGSYGARVAGGNVDGGPDGELLTGPGPGPTLGPHVRAFRRDGGALAKVSFFAYGTQKSGVNVAAGLLDHDAFDEIATGAGPGAIFGPHVRGFDVDGAQVRAMPGVSFFAYQTLRYGAGAAVGSIDPDAFGEIVSAPGPGAALGSQVRGWDFDGTTIVPIPRVSFYAFPGTGYGASVAAGDADGDGIEEMVACAGPAPAYPARLRGFGFDGAVLKALPGFDLTPFGSRYGARAGLADSDPPGGGGGAELSAGAGPDPAAGTTVAPFRYTGTSLVPAGASYVAFPGLAFGVSPVEGNAALRLRCNGSAVACDRPYNQWSEVSTHNAMSNEEDGFWLPTPNQKYSFARQLDDGVRCLMLDTYMDQGQPALCHAYCVLGSTPWIPMLQDLDLWLETHPHDVVTFVLEAYITEAETRQALLAAGIFGRVYHHGKPPGSPWPTLRELCETGQRLVVFTDDGSANGDWHLDWRAYGWETPYDDPTFTCQNGRGNPRAYDNQIFILNHYVLCPAGGCEQNGAVDNAYAFFFDRASRCFRFDAVTNPWTQVPTFLNVDHYHVPAPGAQSPRADAFDVRDAINASWPNPP